MHIFHKLIAVQTWLHLVLRNAQDFCQETSLFSGKKETEGLKIEQVLLKENTHERIHICDVNREVEVDPYGEDEIDVD
jgi:hypothetical protein